MDPFTKPPRTRAALAAFLRETLGIVAPDTPMIRAHHAPLDYLEHAFLNTDEPRDCVVWANRGGGKTFYGAVATALDLVFKPGVEVMVMAGSLDQAARMHAHLRSLFEEQPLSGEVEGKITNEKIRLTNGSRASVIAASPTAIRGARPTILRVDEAELVDRELWTAAQLCVRSHTTDGGVVIPAAVEALSTHHRAGGLMHDLIVSTLAPAPVRRLFRWGVLDVLERCDDRPCDDCALHPECLGRAKRERTGHVSVDDAVRAKGRVDARTWEAEMLSRRPSRSDAVYPEFDPETHVAGFPVAIGDGALRWCMGVDFGFRAPTAMLWACVTPDGVLRIVDERVVSEVTIEGHARAVRDAKWPQPSWMGVDPAGNQRSEQTALSAISVLRREGFAVRARRVRMEDGLRAVRRRLAPASGPPTLLVHERCAQLIEALRTYRYADPTSGNATPAKDGPDHAVDALRYLIVNLDSGASALSHDHSGFGVSP
ncbi:MAG: hypothetical protein AAGH64_05065 [Planctomycetota bacterium]